MRYIGLVALLLSSSLTLAQGTLDSLVPVRGLCVGAPTGENVKRFVEFIDSDLGGLPLNLLILRVDYNYQYQSRPELADENGLSHDQVKEIVAACQRQSIRLIPQINLLGHQSWHSDASNLLDVYPDFDETPWVALPSEGKYEWPNEDGLYCKSYCPLHPEVHNVVFDLVDEIVEVFEADAFHAGLDEVFYLAEDKCSRCSGHDPAQLFADEVTKIRNHLARDSIELWMWGDRLIDGKSTGIGMWEASMNNTYCAIELIPKDVVINDWHYERADPTAALFATAGLRVASCPWRKADVALDHLEQVLTMRSNSTEVMKDRLLGVIQTIWTSAENFMDVYQGLQSNEDPRGDQVECFKVLFAELAQMKK